MNLFHGAIQKLLISLMLVAFVTYGVGAGQERSGSKPKIKPRVIITDDPELDDNNTIIRALLYSTDFDVEGLVYVSSGVHWKGDGKGTKWFVPEPEYTRFGLNLCPCTSWRWAPDEHFIDDIVDAYAKVYPNLKNHNPNYPSPGQLKSKIKWGNVEFDGDYSKDTDGSNLIKNLLLDDQPGPLYVTAGGGQSTMARALKSIHDKYVDSPQWDGIRKKVSRKLVIIPFGDQDGTYASYIEPNWPDVNEWHLAMINFGYGVRNGLAPEDTVYVSAQWTQANISSQGPLGASYRVWGDGKQMVRGDIFDYFGLSGYTADQLKAMGYRIFTPVQEKGSFISEGDTPTFLNLLDNGLRAYADEFYGGWAGRGSPDKGLATGFGYGRGQQQRPIPPRTAAINAKFFAAAQQDFVARMKWSVTPNFRDANHEPQVKIKGPLEVSARADTPVHLRAEVSDPDGNAVTVKWWQYNDAGTYPGDIAIADPKSLATTFRVPADAQPGQTVHVILEATDNGTPALTSYQRVIVMVKSK